MMARPVSSHADLMCTELRAPPTPAALPITSQGIEDRSQNLIRSGSSDAIVADLHQCMAQCQRQLEDDITSISTRFDEVQSFMAGSYQLVGRQCEEGRGQSGCGDEKPASRCSSRARLQEALHFASNVPQQ